jgi:uncharacterized membrane protein YraQ (UPF0718 family)
MTGLFGWLNDQFLRMEWLSELVAYARDQVTEIIHRVWPYVLVGVGIGALIHNWIPQATITALLGQAQRLG